MATRASTGAPARRRAAVRRGLCGHPELEDESPLTVTAAKALELAARLARDMAHPEVAGPHVLIGLTLVADPVLGEIPSLTEISRRSLMDAVGESAELAKGSFFRGPPLPRILSRARKLSSGGEIDAKDLLAAVLSDSVTARMLRRAGVDPKKLEVDVRSAGQRESAKTAA